MMVTTMTILALWSGITILLGQSFIGGLAAMIHALIMIMFRNNLWTPKVFREDEMRWFIVSII